jgi:cysteine desulfurase family protein (TIGR01976 family)
MFDHRTLQAIRADFPALQRERAGGVVSYLDGPGGTQVPQQVIAAIEDYLARHNANTGGFFANSAETDAMLAAARQAMADLVGAASAREIVFGANMTSLTFAFSRALGRDWEPGDEVIVTELDHQANIAPWRAVAAERGVVVRTLRLDTATLTLDLPQLEHLLSGRTRLLAIGAASNAVGTINDVARAATLARQAGALTYVDAVHLAPHRLLDVQQLGCDFLVCSAYKFFGPHVGVLWSRASLLEQLRPDRLPPAPDTAPQRWEPGTLNHEGIAGAAAAVDWLAALGGAAETRRSALRATWLRVQQHESSLFAALLEGLRAIPGVRVWGPAPGVERTPTAAFTLTGRAPDTVARRLATERIFVWSGDFYAPNVVKRLGLARSGGLVRAGLAVYSGMDDVHRLLASLRRLS